jgi:4-hydroxy-2-oxoheptanedioate aldolase
MNNIKQRLQNDQLVVVLGMGRLLHHNYIQMLGIQGGFHGLWFDHEHTGFSMESLEVATLAARSQNLDCFVRIAPTDYAIVTRCLEAGGGGVMAAQIESAAQAREFVQWAKFAPLGKRGLNTSGWDGQYAKLAPAEFCKKANEENFVAIQIETLGALEECDEIASLEGVDHLFVGPSDLSQSLGLTGDFMNPKCLEALDRVAAACKNHGISWGAVCANREHGEMMIEKGCRLISPVSDTKLINIGIQATKEQFSSFFHE